MLTLPSRLASARLNGALVTIDKSEEPINLQAAYSIQEQVSEILGVSSEAWKVGSTSIEAQRKLGTTEPGAARVPKQFKYTDGAAIPVFPDHDLWVEGEFALRIGIDLPPREQPYIHEEILTAIDGVAPSLEFVGSRLKGGIGKSGRFNATADGGANVALCTGKIISNWKNIDLSTNQVDLSLNHKVVASGLGNKALGNPINVMTWLANHLRSSTGLRAGEIVSTGTCTGLVKVSAGDQIEANFGVIGKIKAHLINAVIR
jgi:2-keto-4-pentenoate hydratase